MLRWSGCPNRHRGRWCKPPRAPRRAVRRFDRRSILATSYREPARPRAGIDPPNVL